MKKIFIVALALGAYLFVSTFAEAKPAYPKGIEVVQPDGSTLTIYQHGDEFFHYTTLENGNWVKKFEDGFYREIPAETVTALKQRRVSNRARVAEQVQQAYPLNIAPRGLVILVEFSDLKFTKENTLEVFKDMLSGEDYTALGASGSARQYFYDQSHGKYNPQFDVVGPVTMPQTAAYYGKNNGFGEDQYVDKMVQKACGEADNLGVDFSQYDHNNDGFVDFVFFIYAGYGEADSGNDDDIWPHAYWLYQGYGKRLNLDGKMIDMYACGSELNYSTKKRDGIGTFCHEFGHVLGLPDLYATQGGSHKTWGRWSIMDYGCYNDDGRTPSGYSAYERFFLGWTTPVILNEAASVVLHDLTGMNGTAIITSTGKHNLKGNDPNPVEFYMLENRQQKGWDKYLPGHGMLVSKIKYDYRTWMQNAPNNVASNQCIDIIEADGNSAYNQYFGKTSDLFPRGATEFTPYDNYPITGIEERDSIIYFDFMGGGEELIIGVLDDALVNIQADSLVFAPEDVKYVYDITGQLISNGVEGLERGFYILRTSDDDVKKVYIP